MSLNYGLGQNFTNLVPVLNDNCIFAAINYNLQTQYPNPPGHTPIYAPISLLSSESVVILSSHDFKKALPETDDGVLEYYLSLYSSADGTRTDTKIAEYRPKLSKGTAYSYDLNIRSRVGDYVPQSTIDGSSAFRLSVRRKEDNGQSGLGFAGNQLRYVIMSPVSLVL